MSLFACPSLTHGSLFAGIGGFEMAASEAGIVTKWNCEIEPYPRLVLAVRFPHVKQYGDIKKLNGAEVEPVSMVSFGSPCQSFSQAAGSSRKGLEGKSGLFYEAVRVIKEMRQATNNVFPRYACMENVMGIYSSKSNGRSDFREVLNELLKIKDETVVIPMPKDRKGREAKFLNAGAIVGDGYSLAWRSLCASRFGVAQRRRRMYLIVDFDGERAAEILSEPEGQGRNFTPSYFTRKGSARGSSEGVGSVRNSDKNGVDGDVAIFEPGALKRMGKVAWTDEARTLRADAGDNTPAIAYQTYPIDLRNATRDGGEQGTGIGDDGEPSYTITAEKSHAVAYGVASHPSDSRLKICEDGFFPTVSAKFGTGGGNTHYVLDECKQSAFGISSMESNAMRSGSPTSGIYEATTSRTLDTSGTNPSSRQGGTVIAIQGNVINRGKENGPAGIGFRENVGYTLNTVDHGGAVCYQETVGALCASDYRGIRNQDIGEDKAIVETFGNNGFGKWNTEPATLKAKSGDYPGGENLSVETRLPSINNDGNAEPTYAVRRLTPTECLLLQGFPADHLDNIDIQNPTAEQTKYWRDAYAELGKVKTDNFINKWLANPYSDGNAYRAIGNSLCVPNALWVMNGIVEHADQPLFLNI